MSIAKVFDPYTGGANGGVVPSPSPSGGSWVEKGRFDFTGLDAKNITPPSAVPYTTTLEKGGAFFCDFYLDYSGTGLVYDVNASAAGVRADWISGTTNYLSQCIKVNDLLGVPSMDATTWRGRWAFQMIVDNITYLNQNGERFGFYIASDWNNMLGVANLYGSTIMDNGTGVPATGLSVGFYNGTDVNEYTNEPQPTSACFTMVISNGAMSDQLINSNSGYVDPYTANYGPMLAHRSPNQGIPYYMPFGDAYIGAVSRRKTNATILGFRVLKFE